MKIAMSLDLLLHKEQKKTLLDSPPQFELHSHYLNVVVQYLFKWKYLPKSKWKIWGYRLWRWELGRPIQRLVIRICSHSRWLVICRNLLSIDSRLNRIDPSTNILPPNPERGYRTSWVTNGLECYLLFRIPNLESGFAASLE